MITVISRPVSPFNSLNSPFSSRSLLSAIVRSSARSQSIYLYIYLCIYRAQSSPGRPFRSNRNSLSLPLVTAETNSRNPVRRPPSSRYLKPSDGHSMSEVISRKMTSVALVPQVIGNIDCIPSDCTNTLFNYLKTLVRRKRFSECDVNNTFFPRQKIFSRVRRARTTAKSVFASND